MNFCGQCQAWKKIKGNDGMCTKTNEMKDGSSPPCNDPVRNYRPYPRSDVNEVERDKILSKKQHDKEQRKLMAAAVSIIFCPGCSTQNPKTALECDHCKRKLK